MVLIFTIDLVAMKPQEACLLWKNRRRSPHVARVGQSALGARVW